MANFRHRARDSRRRCVIVGRAGGLAAVQPRQLVKLHTTGPKSRGLSSPSGEGQGDRIAWISGAVMDPRGIAE